MPKTKIAEMHDIQSMCPLLEFVKKDILGIEHWKMTIPHKGGLVVDMQIADNCLILRRTVADFKTLNEPEIYIRLPYTGENADIFLRQLASGINKIAEICKNK